MHTDKLRRCSPHPLSCLQFILLTATRIQKHACVISFQVFSREHLNNWYRVKAYYYAKSLCDFPFQVRERGSVCVCVHTFCWFLSTGLCSFMHHLIFCF